MSEICKEYLKSWKYAIQYYLCGVPDWKYYYSYRVAPFASDILTNLKYRNMDMNTINFSKSNAVCNYCPLEQLLIIMPPQMKKSLPKICNKIMSERKLNTTHNTNKDLLEKSKEMMERLKTTKKASYKDAFLVL